MGAGVAHLALFLLLLLGDLDGDVLALLPHDVGANGLGEALVLVLRVPSHARAQASDESEQSALWRRMFQVGGKEQSAWLVWV